MESVKKSGNKESKVYLNVSITIIICVVIGILITSSILYVNFQSILMKHEYETNLEKMESEEAQRLQLSNIALNTLYQIYKDISVTRLLTFKEIDATAENAAFLQLRYFLVTIPSVDSIYVYNMKNDRIYNVTNESELIKPWNKDYDTRSGFYDRSAVEMIEHCTDYIPFTAVPRYYQVNKSTNKCVYTYIMYDIFKNSDQRNVIMLNLDPEYLFYSKETEASSTRSLIVDSSGKVIYSNSKEFKVLDNVKQDFDYSTLEKDEKSGYYITEINHQKAVVIYTQTDKYGWRYINIIDYNELLSQVNKLQSVIVIITVLIAVVGLIVAFICSYRLSTPIRIMTKDIKTLKSERRQTEIITKRIKLKELLESGGVQSGKSPKSASELLALVGIQMADNQSLVLLCICVDNYRNLLEELGSQIIGAYKFGAVNILNELMGESANTYCLDLSLDKSLLFVVTEGKAGKDTFDTHIQQMQKLVKEYFKISMSVALSDFSQDSNQLFHQYEQMEEALSRSMFWKESTIIHYSDRKILAVQDYEYPESKEKQLIECVTHGKASEAEELYQSIITQTYPYPVVIYNMVISRLVFMINNVVNLIMKNSSIHSLTSSILLTNLLQEFNTVEERSDKFHELFVQIQKDLENKKSDKRNQIITDINLQIHNEYQNPMLSIEMMADQVGMSTAYICRIYKQYTGNTINETLLNKRMEQARYLLEESTLSVNIISEKVGFTNSSYFYRAFKKVNGVTPNEFRRK